MRRNEIDWPCVLVWYGLPLAFWVLLAVVLR